MSDESPVESQFTETGVAHPPPGRTRPIRPLVTIAAIAWCVIVFFGVTSEGGINSWKQLEKWGSFPPDAVWSGAYWALVTSAFVHVELWHVACNVYWLWVLGNCMEREIGSLRYLIFFLTAAFVSSACQLAVGGGTGIGASGVGYAIFGFMWHARGTYPAFRRLLTLRLAQFFVLWAVGCIIVTQLSDIRIGNAAHVSGMVFGLAVADAFVTRRIPKLALATQAMLIVFAIVSLVWSPWSIGWLSHKAYEAHEAHRYNTALDYYSRILRRDDRNAWAHYNRGAAYAASGDWDNAGRDFTKAHQIDPHYEVPK